jgi:hypothetical protein
VPISQPAGSINRRLEDVKEAMEHNRTFLTAQATNLRGLLSLRADKGDIAKGRDRPSKIKRFKKVILLSLIALQFCGYNDFALSVSFAKIPESFRNLT